MSVPFTGSNGRAAGQGEPGIDDISLKAKVAEVLDRWPSAGLAAGVVRDGGLEWFMGHGVADVGSKTPVTKDTVFRIGSITKTFTAIAVMQLHERGLVDLDARERPPALHPADPGQSELPACHGAASADPHRRDRLLAASFRPAPAGRRLGRPGRTIGGATAGQLLP